MDVTRELTVTQRRKMRRLRSWWRHERMSIACALAEAPHHSSRTKPSHTRVVEGALRNENTVTRVRFTFLDEQPAAGERPGPVQDPWPQQRAQRHTVEQIIETFVPAQILDAPVPQSVDQLVDVLKIIGGTVGGSANSPFLRRTDLLIFQFRVIVVGVSQFLMISCQDVAVEVFKVSAQDKVQQHLVEHNFANTTVFSKDSAQQRFLEQNITFKLVLPKTSFNSVQWSRSPRSSCCTPRT